jgi:hypothetical protein
MEYIAGKALRMNTHQGGAASARHFAHLQRHGFFHAAIGAAFESEDPKVSEPGRKIRFGSLVQK